MRQIKLVASVHATTGLLAITAPAMPGFVLFAETPADAENRIERAVEAFMLDAFDEKVVCHLEDELAPRPGWASAERPLRAVCLEAA